MYKEKKKSVASEQTIRLQFQTRLVERYDKIMLLLPSNVYAKDFNYEKVADKDQFLRAMRSYFDLCSHQFFLHKIKKIDPEVWEEWEEGMKAAINTPAVLFAWKELPRNQNMYPELNTFFNKHIH